MGAKVEARLVEYFGGEAKALEAIAGCRLSLIAEAVGAPMAHRIVQGAYKLLYGNWPREIAGTSDAWRLYLEARRIVENHVYSPPGRDLLSCLVPLPPSAHKAIETRQRIAWLGNHLLRALATQLGRLRDALRELTWPRPHTPRVSGRVLAVIGDHFYYEEAMKKLGRLVRVVYVDDPRGLEELSREESDIVVYDPQGLYAGQLPKVEELTITQVLPEHVIDWYRANKQAINALVKAIEVIGASGLALVFSTLGYRVDAEKLIETIRYASLVVGSDINPSLDPEYARLRKALAKLDNTVDEVETWANTLLQERLSSRELRIPGQWLLEVLRSLHEGSPPPSLPEDVLLVFEEIAEQAEKAITEKLQLDSDESELVRGVFPRTPRVPLEADRGRLEELRLLLLSKLHIRRMKLLQQVAEKLYDKEGLVEVAVEALALADIALAEAEILQHGTSMPSLIDTLGVAIVNGIEASLYQPELAGHAGIQRVSYVVGETPIKPPATHGERIVLLTGANSGGKTTLLKMIAETVLAAQSGLPVTAEKAWVGLFNQVYFLSKPQGMADAGALEQTLRLLAEIAYGKGRRLVLVDELEAATEADAAAKIISGFVEALAADNQTVAVVVTHLAPEVLESLEKTIRQHIRVDGIEAKGLDENYNLVVDRNPRYNYLARSTPELVVTKLLHRAQNREKEFYKRVLDKLSRGQ